MTSRVVFTFNGGNNPEDDIVGAYIDTAGVVHGFLLRNGVFSTIDFPEPVLPIQPGSTRAAPSSASTMTLPATGTGSCARHSRRVSEKSRRARVPRPSKRTLDGDFQRSSDLEAYSVAFAFW